MARTEARIKCDIWDDEDFRSLTWEAQWLYHAILEQKDLSLCGVLTWTPKRFAKLASNASAATTKKALDLLRSRRYVLVDEDTDELLVRTFITGDRVLDNPNSILGMSNAFGAIHSQALRDAVVDRLGEGFLEGLPDLFPKGLPQGFHDRLGKPFVKALALAGACAPPGAPIPPSSLVPSPSSSSPPAPPDDDQPATALPTVAPQVADDDEESTTKALIADRRMASATKVIKNPAAYRTRTLENVEYELGFKLRQLLADGMTPEAVADVLCPKANTGDAEPVPSREQLPPAFNEVLVDGEWQTVRVSA